MPSTRQLLDPARRLALAVLLVLAGVAVVQPALAYPRPSPVPVRWELDFDAGPLRLYVDRDGKAYWYFTYVITNRTGRDQVWAPSIVLYTDRGEILEAGRGVSMAVEDRVRAMLGNDLLETHIEIIGDILQGREHARDGLAVWPADREDVTEMSLFVGGISGETTAVVHPRTGERVLLRKTLQRDYVVRGLARAYGDRPFELRRQRWVMR